MNRVLLINKTPATIRAGLLEEGKLVELYFDHIPSRSRVGNLYRGRVRKVLPGISAAFIDIGSEQDGFLYLDEGIGGRDASWEDLDPLTPGASVEGSALRVGQVVTVQVERDTLGEKGPRVTRLITLPGRFLVHLPLRSIVGVSRKIEEDERARLREIGMQIQEEVKGGFIIRTAAKEVGGETLLSEARMLREFWDGIVADADHAPVPSLIQAELPLPIRLVRDLSGEGMTAIVVDDESLREQVRDYLGRLPLASRPRCDFHDGSLPLFEAHNVEKQVQRAFFSKVWLKHGGYIVINQTEALVAVDVNSGKFLGKGDLEETAIATNLEAVGEIVRQVRLRNLGGIIVLDFIDMEKKENRERLIDVLQKEFRKDRANSRILNVSSFGLVEMTRKRTKENVIDRLTALCPYCRGVGRVKTVQTVCHDLYNELMKQVDAFTSHIAIHAHPDVVKTFTSEWISGEAEGNSPWSSISWFPEERFHIEEFKISSS